MVQSSSKSYVIFPIVYYQWLSHEPYLEDLITHSMKKCTLQATELPELTLLALN